MRLSLSSWDHYNIILLHGPLHIGPKAWPLIGNIPEMIKNYTKTREESLYHQWHLKYGPIFQMRGVGKDPQFIIIIVYRNII